MPDPSLFVRPRAPHTFQILRTAARPENFEANPSSPLWLKYSMSSSKMFKWPSKAGVLASILNTGKATSLLDLGGIISMRGLTGL